LSHLRELRAKFRREVRDAQKGLDDFARVMETIEVIRLVVAASTVSPSGQSPLETDATTAEHGNTNPTETVN
jgi:hypothetical protein